MNWAKDFNFLDSQKPIDLNLFSSSALHIVAASSIKAALEDPILYRIFSDEILICDSKIISILLKFVGVKHYFIRGADFLRKSLSDCPSSLTNHFIVSSDIVSNSLITEITKSFPDLTIGRIIVPLIGDSNEILRQIENDFQGIENGIIWVGLGSPKQDFLTSQIHERFGLTVCGVGAAIDYLSGESKEAPSIIRNSGFEWLYRLVKEPRRLWRRYLVGNTQIVLRLIRP
jgi:exopolysaccharide biosynthesis WecB/TagA/CpsF family protein